MDNISKELINRLGEPYYKNDYGILYNLDCLEAMKHIPSNFINQTFTSPPYNIGKEYEQIMELNDYLDWCKSWISEIYRITSENGSFWLNVGYLNIPTKGKAVPIAYLLWNISQFYLQQEIVWNYGAGVAAKRFLSRTRRRAIPLRFRGRARRRWCRTSHAGSRRSIRSTRNALPKTRLLTVRSWTR